MSNVSQGDSEIPKFQLEIDNPEGRRIEIRNLKQPEYTPPSRERVAEVVRISEVRIQNGEIEAGEEEIPMGALLREASDKLYRDASANTDNRIFPHALLAEVLTDTRVMTSLCLDSSKTTLGGRYSTDFCLEKIRGDRASDTLGEFARVFTVLLLCDKPVDIIHFFDNDANDKCFPFEVKDRKLRSKVWNTVEDKSLYLKWTGMRYDAFKSTQWSVFLPYFSEEFHHQDFERAAVMPWHICPVQVPNDNMVTSGTTTSTSTNGEAGTLSGGHSFVSRVIIHDGHYRFSGIPQVSTTESSLNCTVHSSNVIPHLAVKTRLSTCCDIRRQKAQGPKRKGIQP